MCAQSEYFQDNDPLFRSIFEYSAIGIALVGLDGRWLAVNPAVCFIVGYEEEELLAIDFQTITHPDDVNSDLELMDQLASGRIISFNLKKRYFHKDRHIVWVLLTVSLIRNADYSPRFVISQIQDISARVLAEAEHEELLRDNRMLTQNLFAVQEKERRHLERELHDELGQWLTAIHAEAQAISNSVCRESNIYAGAQAISENIKSMNEVIRDLLRRLRPVMLDKFGLAESLRELKSQWCLHNVHTLCELTLEGDFKDLREIINITIYRIVQEALSNVCKHAHATRVLIRLSFERGLVHNCDTLLLSIADNGKGCNPGEKFKGLGLLGMRERTIAAGGNFTLHSVLGSGTQINVRLPIQQQGEDL